MTEQQPETNFERLLPDQEHAEPQRPGEALPQTAPETNAAETRAEARQALAEIGQADQAPNPLEKLQAEEEAIQAEATAAPATVNRELKQIALRRELKHIRRQLPAPQRLLSSVIHQPAIRLVSEAAGKSISRPSGLLGGGLVAFLGSSGYLYLARRIGWRYNYLISALLFVIGFAIGIVLELAVWLATSSRRQNN